MARAGCWMHELTATVIYTVGIIWAGNIYATVRRTPPPPPTRHVNQFWFAPGPCQPKQEFGGPSYTLTKKKNDEHCRTEKWDTSLSQSLCLTTVGYWVIRVALLNMYSSNIFQSVNSYRLCTLSQKSS